MDHAIFSEFALILFISAAAGLLAVRLKQPVLIAYIVVGIAVSPAFLGLVTAQGAISLLSHVGVAVLLFAVGLKLDLQHVRHIGPVALATGLGQLAFTILGGFVIIVLLGRPVIEALYVAIALTFSSTIIIVKLLTDKRELDSLHGRIAVGFLIVQDLAVVLAMMGMSALRAEADTSSMAIVATLVGRIAAAGVLLFILMRYLLPPLVKQIARSQELLLVFAIAWGTSLAALGEWAGFSKEAGAFIAGFSLASTAYRDAIHGRLAGIRDFLLLFFFIDLGSKLDLSTLGAELGDAVVLSLFVLIGNPLIVLAIMGFMGYRRRTGFLAGLTVAQISEFSIIFIAMGVTLGHVRPEALGLTTLVGLVTITLSTYMILYSHPLYERLSPWLRVFERKRPFRELAVERDAHIPDRPGVLVVGLGRYGASLARGLRDREVPVIGIDFDPEAVREQRQAGLPVRYGDASEEEFLATLPLHEVGWVIGTLPDREASLALLRALRSQQYQGHVALVARHAGDAQVFEGAGADTVFQPLADAVRHTLDVVCKLLKNP